MLKKSVVLLAALCALITGCKPGNSKAIAELFSTTTPITFRVGYVLDSQKPPNSFSGAAASGWVNGETMLLADIICNNMNALLPNKSCFFPATENMTPLVVSHSPEGYTDDDIFVAAERIPANSSDIKVVFLDAEYVTTDTSYCTGETCGFGRTLKRVGRPDISAIFLPRIKKYVDAHFGSNFSADVFGYIVSAVTIHEVGHQLGLVNGETSAVTDHEDAAGAPNHCANPKCIMHATGPGISWWEWSKNHTSGVGDLLFDNACTTDIQAAITYPR